MSNLPKPISNYIERFDNQYKSLKLDNADASTIEELILNNKAQINNLLMSGLGASTLMLRLGAVINLSIKLEEGSDEKNTKLEEYETKRQEAENKFEQARSTLYSF